MLITHLELNYVHTLCSENSSHHLQIATMAPPPTHTRNRRRKKRRTEDFSSDSSSSDSEAEQVADSGDADAKESAVKESISEPEVNIDDIDIDSDTEKAADPVDNTLPEETKEQLAKVNFTVTDGLPLNDAKLAVSKGRAQLENEYLAFMASTFANDLDELRKKPDFTDKSIVMLAKTLQSGANMFDDETLEALLNAES